MSGGAWAAWSLLIGYLALAGVGITVALVRDERYGYATAAFLVTVLLAYGRPRVVRGPCTLETGSLVTSCADIQHFTLGRL
jgi:hypothetical protein